MLETSIVDQGTINTTLPDPGDPTYQTESLCLFLKQQFAALRTEGFKFQKAQIADLSSWETDLEDWLSDAQDREDQILQQGYSSIVATLPDVLAIGSAYMSGGADAVLGCLVNIILERTFGGSQAATGSYNQAANTPNFNDLIDKLEEIRVQIDTILTEFNINLYEDPTGASWTVGNPS